MNWIPIPKDFSLQLRQGKNCDTTVGTGRDLWEQVLQLLQARPIPSVESAAASMFCEPTLVRQRLGQGSFRVLITDTYERRCAVTGDVAECSSMLDAVSVRQRPRR